MTHVGDSWESTLGTRTVTRIDGERVYVSREGTGIQEIMPLSFVPRAKLLDAAKLQQQVTVKQPEPQDNPYQAFLDAEYATPMRRGKAKVSLDRSIQYNGEVIRSHVWIERVVAAGGRLAEVNFGKPETVLYVNGTRSNFYAKPQINGVLIAYARYLIEKGEQG